mgnify:CR=1 FL=1
MHVKSQIGIHGLSMRFFLDISANVDRACNGNELSIPVTSLMEKRAVHIEAKFQSDKRIADGKTSRVQNGVGN